MCLQVSATTLMAMSPARALAADKLDELWSEGQHLLEPAGISKPMFRSVTVWSEGQYYIGYCSAHLDPDEVAFWRNWWERTVVPRSEIGQNLIASAGASYEKGLRDGAAQRPSGELCRRTLESWTSDMEAANEVARRERR
jgi:hypothetical protein